MQLAPDVLTLLEVWDRRHEPESHDLLRTVRVAEHLEADPRAPQVLLALAYRLVDDVHEAAGWPVPGGVKLSRCAGAAASVRHGCTLLMDRVGAELGRAEGPVVLWGALGASQALFGCWDALPAHGEVLVDQSGKALDPLPSEPFGQHGLRWTGSGVLGEELARRATPAKLADGDVLVPHPSLYVALVSGLQGQGFDVPGLVFCAAARTVTAADGWGDALELARALGRGRSPVEAAMRLGITDRLGLSVGPVTRLSVALSRLAGRRQRRR